MSKPRPASRVPYRGIIGLAGVALILAGYVLLAIDPGTEPAIAIKRAFTGMGMVIAGGVFSLGALLFAK
ncbi:MAG TPA: hypothetical protein VMV75_11265 [Sulfuricella sp.]|nr:hypothetical protein [Sulfuricella sp.]